MSVRPEYVLAAGEDSPFYGRPRSTAQLMSTEGGERLQPLDLPPGWLRHRWGGWEGWTPWDWAPRLQGWKIHVSAVPDDATETLVRTTRICIDASVAFKFLHERGSLLDSNAKQQDRGASGKFVTIYPDDDDQFASLLRQLEAALADQAGPYILSDLRYDRGPVYARYGGIMPMTLPDELDRPVSAIGSVASTTLNRDERQPRFLLPDGVELPACLTESYARFRSSEPSRLREFKSVSPLHFSNAGGVYKATLPDGTRRVLREARSHTGFDGRGRDGVTRQRAEQAVLADLAGLPSVQQLVGSFWAWEHRYLELEYAEGSPLTAWVVRNSAFTEGADGGNRRRYAERAVGIGRRLVDAIAGVHDRGWCIGDLHPGNVVVDENDGLTLIDFEDATRCGAEREIGFRVFEYCAPESFSGVEADWYAVSRSLMLMYVPDWEIEVAAPDFWQVALQRVRRLFGDASAEQIEDVCRRFPSSNHLLSPRVTVHSGAPATAIVPALDAGIEWSRQFSPAGSFPGDPAQQGDVTETFGYGRAGVVWTRARLSRAVPDSDLDRLQAAARADGGEPGLYQGRSGLALALADAGRLDAAVEAASGALDAAVGRRRLDLHGGLAGSTLVALEVARLAGNEELLAEAVATNERLQRAVEPDRPAWAALTERRGLAFGLTGLALTDLVAHLATGRADLLDRALARVRDDLDACFVTSDGDLMVRDVENNRALPYVEWGSAGVWGVARAVERCVGRRLLTEVEYAGMVSACSSDIYVYDCLDHGRAGIIAVLAGAGPEHAAEVARQRAMLADNLLSLDEMAFTVGDGLVRLSADLATGAAGVALALHCADASDPFAWLPVSRTTAAQLAALPAAGGPAWPAAVAAAPVPVPATA